MKKKKSVVLSALAFAFLLNGQTAIAQENNSAKAVKLYTNFSWTSTEDRWSLDSANSTSSLLENKETQIDYFTPAFAIYSPNGNFQELEISRLQFNHSNNAVRIQTDSTGQTSDIVIGQKITRIFIAFRYEYDILLFKQKTENKVQWYTGFSASPYFSNSKFSPIVSNLYPTNENKMGVTLSVIPRLHYNVNDRWFVDLNVPVNLFDFNVNVKNDSNPTLPDSQNKTTTLELETFPSQVLIRLGVGLRL
jgi:hypothetical protein